MRVYNYLRRLSPADRDELANEIGSSSGYMNVLRSDKDRKPSIAIVKKIWQSDFNSDLPRGLQFTEEDFVDYCNTYIEEA